MSDPEKKFNTKRLWSVKFRDTISGSIHLPDTLQTHSRCFQLPSIHLPYNIQTPSRCIHGTFQTPFLHFRHLSETFQASTRHLPVIFQSPSINLSDTFQIPSRHHPGSFYVPSRHLPGTFQTPSTHLPDTLQAAFNNFRVTFLVVVLGGWLDGLHNHATY